MPTFVIRVINDGKLVELGRITAKHQPAALKLAWERWPEHVKHDVQGGFSVQLAPADKAFSDGQIAYFNGVERLANPYPAGSQEAKCWEGGWYVALEDEQPSGR